MEIKKGLLGKTDKLFFNGQILLIEDIQIQSRCENGEFP